MALSLNYRINILFILIFEIILINEVSALVTALKSWPWLISMLNHFSVNYLKTEQFISIHLSPESPLTLLSDICINTLFSDTDTGKYPPFGHVSMDVRDSDMSQEEMSFSKWQYHLKIELDTRRSKTENLVLEAHFWLFSIKTGKLGVNKREKWSSR